MAIYKISYSIREDEFNKEVERLLASSNGYLRTYASMVEAAMSLSNDGNYEGCISTIGKMRDALSEADYRLHDLTSLILSYVQTTAEPDAIPVQHQEAQEQQEVPAFDNSKLEEVKTRAQQIKANIQSLGIEISDEQLEELTRKANDKAS